jgi:hypothetical protein
MGAYRREQTRRLLPPLDIWKKKKSKLKNKETAPNINKN